MVPVLLFPDVAETTVPCRGTNTLRVSRMLLSQTKMYPSISWGALLYWFIELSTSDCQELYTVIIWTALLRRRWTVKDTYSKAPPTKTQISFNWWRTCLHLKIKDILLCIAPHLQTLEWPPLASVSPHENILLLVNGVTWKKALCTSVYSNLNFDGNRFHP